MAHKLIVNLAPTGMVPTKEQNPALPESPAEIAADCRRCRDLGASIFHIHAREEGRPTHRKELFAAILSEVRAKVPDAILCVTCSGRNVAELAKRAEVLELEGELRPDMASLTLGSLNFPGQASVNAPETIAGLAARMRERGILPELEAFEVGMVEVAHALLRRGVLSRPLYFNLLLGSLGTISLNPLNLGAMIAALPQGATWAVAGIGRFQLAANVMGIAAGGHVRVGLEDNIHWDEERTTLATNPRLVERVVGIARAMGREPATPDETRAMIGLPPRR